MKFIVCMGVSGSGKSTIGKMLAERLGLNFYDGDDFHPWGNVEKMRSGLPLTDMDREDWLFSLKSLIAEKYEGVLACSALKKSYRETLREGGDIDFVFLHGEKELLLKRIKKRTGHFMPASLLESQLETLEIPERGIRVDVKMSPAQCLDVIVQQLF